MSYPSSDKQGIAIFGDSFGDGFCDPFTGDIVENQNLSHKFHWSKILEKTLDKKVTNYSSGGSSLYYSIRQFLKHQAKHEVVIFLVTSVGRYTKPVEMKDRKTPFFISNLINLTSFKEYDVLTPSYRDILGFFMSQDMEYETFIHHTFIDKILQTNCNTILIPCFRGSLSEEVCRDNNIVFNLWDFTLETLKKNQLEVPSFEEYEENIDLFSGHMLPELNDLVASNLKHRILTGKWDWKEVDLALNYKFKDLWRKK